MTELNEEDEAFAAAMGLPTFAELAHAQGQLDAAGQAVLDKLLGSVQDTASRLMAFEQLALTLDDTDYRAFASIIRSILYIGLPDAAFD